MGKAFSTGFIRASLLNLPL